MPSESLTVTESEIVKKTLHAIAHGSFIDDWEFETLIGLSREEVKEIADKYPKVDEYDESATGCDDSWLAINNSFVNLLEFSKETENEYREYIPVCHAELEAIYSKWKNGK